MHTVYILQSFKTKKYYIGCTNNLEKRLSQHNNKENVSTKSGCPWKLITYIDFENQQEAYQYEKKIKSYKGGNAFKKIISGRVAERPKAKVC